MKKFLALVMAAVLLCSTFSFTFAETVTSCDNGHLYAKDADGKEIEAEVVTAPTCTTDGVGTKYCTRCEKNIEVTIPALNHIGAEEDRLSHTDATCTAGSTALYSKCSRPGCKATNITLPYQGAKGHEWDLDETDPKNYKKVAPTCTEDGYTIYYCVREECPGDGVNTPAQKKVVDTNSKLGHDWYIATQTVDPTCYAQGVSGQYIYCYRCKLHAADDVLEGDDVVIKNEDGEVVTNPSVDAHYVPALSHDITTEFGADFVDTFFVYEIIDGERVFIDATNFVKFMGEGTHVLNPDLNNKDYIDSPFDRCGTVTVEYKPVTCKENGSLTVKCSCGYEHSEIIVATDHIYHQMAIKYVDSKGKTQELELNWEDVYDIVSAAGLIEDAADFLDLDLTVEKLLLVLYKAEYITEGEMLDCTINPIVQYICVKCKDRVDGEAAACKEHHFGTADEIEAYLEGDADFMTGRLVKVTQLQVPEYDGNDDKTTDWEIYERGDQLEVIAKTLKGFNKKIALCTKYDVTVECAHCAATKTFTCNTNAKHKLPKASDNDLKHYIVIREATCTVSGLVIKHCTDDNCGYSVAENTPVLVHTKDFMDLSKTVVVAATCTEDGTRTLYCKFCEKPFEEKIPSYGHNYKWEITKAASCKVEGERKLTCTRCGDVKETEIIPEAHIIKGTDMASAMANVTAKTNINEKALFAAFTIAKDADGNMIGYHVPEILPWTDCSKEGNLQYVCVNCKAVTVKHAPTEHIWVEGNYDGAYTKFIDDETCREYYTQHYYCAKCDAKDKKELYEDHPHVFDGDFSEVYIPTTTAPTCKESGLGFYPCAFCGEHFVDEVPAFNHSFQTVYDAEKGAWTYVCEWCGELETVEYAVEKYTINTDSIVWGNKTTGTGYVTLENDVQGSFVMGQRYAYIQWTWVTKAGDNVVADTVVELKALDKGEYSFNAKGVSVAGATLDNVVIYITDDADAVDFSSTNYGATRMD